MHNYEVINELFSKNYKNYGITIENKILDFPYELPGPSTFCTHGFPRYPINEITLNNLNCLFEKHIFYSVQ